MSPNFYEEYDNPPAPEVIFLPCGSSASFDHDSGVAHRCDTCGAVVGSVSQPVMCRTLEAKYETWRHMGGKGWDYIHGGVRK
jgi:hypothetical protein